MAQTGIDNNRVATALAVDTNNVTQPLRVDAATSRLLIVITPMVTTTPATLALKIDDNRVGTSEVVTDDANETVTPLIIDTRTGFLFVDVLEE